ncbi:alpha-L-rhamnosidase [Promicromonospora sp. AC04]|uniref:alpha-L-rhamnosidase n=1 Tax=Promicromonospora sp. AC04 TaxID=2135723 RepID=UPI000D3CAD05|nr:alpha-L-rhamnosidase [Promicromonospora sp. AC04]PUB25997.1 alpha-L-rhamnosidase [Promicromonospora sp. AC04]
MNNTPLPTDGAATSVSRVRVERRTDGAFADNPTPRLSWTVESAVPGWWQAGAEVRLDGDQVRRLDTDESRFVPWPFDALAPHARHTLEVRVTGTDGEISPWSEPVTVRSTFLADGEWAASFVGLTDPAEPATPGLLRAELDLDGEVTRATLYASAHGVYQVEINGQDVDDAVLKPGWTAYQHRLVHEATDVTALLRSGANAVGVRLAGGWWTEQYGFHGAARTFYGDQPAAAVQLHVELADGTTRVLTTGPDWRGAATGPVVTSGIYAGERIDAGRAVPGWSLPGFDDSAWPAVRVDASDVVPEPAIAEPVRRVDELPVREVITTPSGRTVLDFGQNLVGRLRVQVMGERGQVITLRHAEVLEDGELGVRPLRAAAATDHLVLSGGADVFEPEFTFHGFRYAELDGWPGELDVETARAAITVVVVSSDMRRTGWFDSSDERVNRLHENVVWGMRGNFVSLPTDCPQRDERLGWTGDIQVFGPTASYLFDSDAFLASWLRDVAVEQADRGGVCPIVVPFVLSFGSAPAAAWGDAATVVPSTLLERFADRRALAEQYASMRAWADVLLGIAGDRLLWEGMFQFGDWLDPDAPPDDPAGAKADPDIVASAHLVRSLQLVTAAARELGDDAAAGRYGDLAERARQAWVREYTTPAGRVVSDAQTAYALAIRFDLVDGATRQVMGDRLAWLVRRAGYRIGTGFVGTPIIQDALTVTGHADVAARLLLQTGVPSWLYAVTMGATTVWERWDSMLPDGSINPGEMTSFNHYAFGAVADWLHRTVAGLAPDAPGYRRLRIAPVPIAGLDRASTRHETPYGIAEAGWAARDGRLVVRAMVPPNTTAVVVLPGAASGDETEVGSGRHEWTVPDPRVRAEPRPVTLGSTLGEIADDPEAYAAVLDAFDALGPESGTSLRSLKEWTDQRTLQDELVRLPSGAPDRLRAALDELNSRRRPASVTPSPW